MAGKLTIREIAKMAGVSPTAVSFVLNNKNGVSDETRKKVNEVIKRTNFTPSFNSRRLFFNKSFNISVIMRKSSSPFDDLFYFEITKGILAKSKEFGYNMVFSEIIIEGKSIVLPEIIKRNDTDGIIFLSDTEKIILNEINRLDIPYVVIDAHSLENNITWVTADYYCSSYTATKYLIENGHKDIAFIGSSFVPEFYIQTFSGFKKAMEENALSISPSWIQIEATDDASSYEYMKRILNSAQIPTAVFCSVDMFAVGAIACAKEHGYRVPGDISFIGIDDVFISSYIEPKLTTVRLDKELMGMLAMELIIKKINNEPAESVVIDSGNIVVRDSVCRINK